MQDADGYEQAQWPATRYVCDYPRWPHCIGARRVGVGRNWQELAIASLVEGQIILDSVACTDAMNSSHVKR